MKALTIHQPWASLIIAGIKDVENRKKRTNHRGRLVIHTGLGIDEGGMEQYGHLLDDFPNGAILGEVILVDCVNNSRSRWAIPGYWHWVLADPRPRKRLVWVRGYQGLWNYGR